MFVPLPVLSQINLGVLKEEDANIIIHGHDYTQKCAALPSPEMMTCQEQGAKGINLVGMLYSQ
jgi:carbon-monoxide dehydrogenase catalytic subunit